MRRSTSSSAPFTTKSSSRQASRLDPPLDAGRRPRDLAGFFRWLSWPPNKNHDKDSRAGLDISLDSPIRWYFVSGSTWNKRVYPLQNWLVFFCMCKTGSVPQGTPYCSVEMAILNDYIVNIGMIPLGCSGQAGLLLLQDAWAAALRFSVTVGVCWSHILYIALEQPLVFGGKSHWRPALSCKNLEPGAKPTLWSWYGCREATDYSPSLKIKTAGYSWFIPSNMSKLYQLELRCI